MNKITIGLYTLFTTLLLTACGNQTGSALMFSNSKDNQTQVTKKSSSLGKRWLFQKNTYTAGNATYRFTKSRLVRGDDRGTTVLVLYCDITNNSEEKYDPSNVYMYIHAYQKTGDRTRKQLEPGIAKRDSYGKNPLQKYEDNIQNKLLPHKTAHAVIVFKLENKQNVMVSFENSNFETISTKSYVIQ